MCESRHPREPFSSPLNPQTPISGTLPPGNPLPPIRTSAPPPHFRAVWSGKVVVGTAATLFLHFYRLRTSHKVPLRRARADGGKGGRGDFRNRPPRNVEANVPTWGVCVCGGLALSNGAGRGRVATEVRPGPKATRLALPSASGGTMVEGERAFGPKGSPGSRAPYQS